MNKPIKLPCGINKNGEIVYIENAKNGLACECVCPGCKQPLIAKNGGSKREAHFAHLNTVECEHGYQSALHYLAKDLFLEIQYLTFIKNRKVERYKIDKIEIEQRLDNIIPDILVTCDGKRFLVEIFVTHALDDEKKAKIKSMMISTIEINLSRFHNELITKDALRQELCNPNNFSWIYDADEDLISHKKEIIKQYGLKRAIESWHAVQCPLLVNQPNQYAKFVSMKFCIHCPDCFYQFGQKFIHCGKILPMPLSNETRSKLFPNIFINDRIVMVDSKFQRYQESFNKNLEEAIKAQFNDYNLLRQQVINMAAQQYRSLEPDTRKINYHHSNRRRRF